MPNQAEVSRIDDNVIKVTGCLDVTTVSRYRDEGMRLIDEAVAPVIDLSNVTVAGSAVIALLIAWQRHAAKSGKELTFVRTPANLMDIARACGVDDIVRLHEGEE